MFTAESLDPRNYDNIPPVLVNAMMLYAEEGHPVGGFLQAVIANDFLDAVGRADIHSMQALPAIACWVYNEMPSPCHGSRTVYEKWILWHKAKRCGDSRLATEARRMLDEAKSEAGRWNR